MRTLGWHRTAATRTDPKAVRHQKHLIFWLLYTIDKTLSLRIGQSSLLQDCDIEIEPPAADPTQSFASLSRLGCWVKSARIMDLVYQRLYSPGALRHSDALRFEAVQQLLHEVEDGYCRTPSHTYKKVIPSYAGILTIRCVSVKLTWSQEVASAKSDQDKSDEYLDRATKLIQMSDDITYYALLCMIYRATPTTAQSTYIPAIECIRCARAALDSHSKCAAMFKDQAELWAMYLHWSVSGNSMSMVVV